jgi:8-oxo-dGTP diphosphatase
MAREPINAAGGIVTRGGTKPRIAVVRRSKDDRWVLPRGKLKRDESPIAGARREAIEETGHRVEVYEFLGAITYVTRGRPKLVQFWRMKAAERPSRDLTADIEEVEWLPLGAAIRRLSFPLEKLFLRAVGRRMLKRRHRRKPRRRSVRAAARTRRTTTRKKPSTRRARKKRHLVATTRPATKRHVAPVHHAATPALSSQRAAPLNPGIFRRLLGRAVTVH